MVYVLKYIPPYGNCQAATVSYKRIWKCSHSGNSCAQLKVKGFIKWRSSGRYCWPACPFCIYFNKGFDTHPLCNPTLIFRVPT